ncbi:hypothetical protein AK812_SmicGene43117 [Symbiodinium microadriaticum]|uniref:Uncharacterized protein n=1 Tax=Symbiodinium microadriaticum TaxID=2951 RepID=A0A1Q9C1U2_SYMMI|nr:hypothetical protein AK812_SmicGene43117 [Symbiodinium microadriaticum]
MRANAIAAVDASAAPAQGFGRHSVRKLKPRLGWSQIGAKFWQTPSDSCPVVEAPTILDRVVQAAWDPTLEAEMRSVCVKQSTKSQDDSTGPFAVIRGGSREWAVQMSPETEKSLKQWRRTPKYAAGVLQGKAERDAILSLGRKTQLLSLAPETFVDLRFSFARADIGDSGTILPTQQGFSFARADIGDSGTILPTQQGLQTDTFTLPR